LLEATIVQGLETKALHNRLDADLTQSLTAFFAALL